MNLIDMSTEGWTQEEVIEFRKLLNQQIKNARKESRHDACMLCGKKGGFCNSHTIPQFCLENIAWNGTLNSFNTLIDSELLANDSGVNNAGTFHIICKPCDGKAFQDYEKEAAFETRPTEKALNQIALKTALRDIYKHETELAMFEACKQMVKDKSPALAFFAQIMFNAQINAKKRDIQECYEVYNVSKSCLTNPKSWIRLVSYDKLDYTSPIAFQGMIALVTGVNGELINNNFNHKSNYKLEYLHIAIFPLKESTAVILFMDSHNTRYAHFENYIANITQEQRLKIINRIIFLYTEDYYLSKQLDSETINWLQETAKLIQDLATTDPKKSVKNAVKDYDLRRDICIPNLFSKEYAIKKATVDGSRTNQEE
ncbi:MAG: hypothetical protein J6A88_07185 [Oscillospiraceae bacterium]|nr:hypothetical protein [Oscillospiraceae bacterium]